MDEEFARKLRGVLRFAGCAGLLLLLALPTMSTPSIADLPNGRSPAVAPITEPSVPAPNLTIALPEFPQKGTANTTLTAEWGAPPTGCEVKPMWAEWYLPSPSSASGTFLSPDRAQTLLVPTNLTEGITEVGVRSDANLECGAANRTLASIAFANVTTYATLSVVNASVDPSAASAPGLVQFRGVVAGGRPPYLLGVDWRDGTYTNRTLYAPGPFEVPHLYTNGTFLLRWGILDADRIDVRGTIPQPVEVTNETALAINASLPLAEVGVPIAFHGWVQRPGTNRGAAIACGTDPLVDPEYFVTNVTCTPTAPGSLPVTFKVGAPVPNFVAQKTLNQTVAPSVSVFVRPESAGVDAGTRTYLRVTIVGGVPPFQVYCSSFTGPVAERADAPADGSFLIPWTPRAPGVAELNASVTDSLGVTERSPTVRAVLARTPELVLQPTVVVGPAVSTVTIGATILGGTSPAFWGIQTSSTVLSTTTPSGTTSNGSFAWSGTTTSEGVATFVAELTDPAGSVVVSPVSVALPLALAMVGLNGTVPTSGTAGVDLSLTISGGVPPFDLWVNSSGSELWNGSDPAEGPYFVVVDWNLSGPVTASVTVEDARGVRVVGNLTVAPDHSITAPPFTSESTQASVAPELVAGSFIAGAAGLAWVRWRRREPPAIRSPPDPESVLERLLRPADGADRLTIELMAEEEGVPLEVVHETLDRLVREGRVRSEAEPDGGEVLAWAGE